MKRTGTNPLAACSPTRPSGVTPRPTTMRAAVVTLLALAPVGCVDRSESVISSTFDQRLPVNASVFVLVTPPLEVSFERVDTATPQPLEHDAVGSGTSRSDVVYIVDPGDVAVGDAIEVLATCVPDCPERNRATITFDREADLDAPVVQDGEVTARVGGVRDHPFNPMISRYEVDLRFGEVVDDSPTFVRFRSDELEAIRPTGGLSAFVEVDGGIQRRFCFDADLIDAAGNETILARDLCVDLDPATAPPWGEMPAGDF
jgi:hypothetical protein